MKPFVIASFIAAAALGLNAQAQSQSQAPRATRQDTSFIHKAAEANLSEVELGKLAAQRSQNDQVKQFAEHLQMDHQGAMEKLQSIAQTQGIQIPQALDSKHQHEVKRLEKLSGTEFDKEFATTAMRDHVQTIALFQKEAQEGQDSAAKQYAESLVPTLQHHLEMARDVAKNVGVKESTISSILGRHPEAVGGANTPEGQQGVGTSGKSHD